MLYIRIIPLHYYMASVTASGMEPSDWLRRIFSGPFLSLNGPALSRNGPALLAIHYEMKNRKN